MSKRPNVLFIISDQHNAKVTGYAGHPDVKTPHLDKLAAAGTRCENAITQNPICTPSRTCYLSGQYCHNHGYYGLSGPNPKGLPTIFGHFRRHGYTTAALGKIHCPEYWVEDDCDVFHETCNTSIGGRSAAYERFLAERGKLELEDHTALTEFGGRGRQSMEGRVSPCTYEESQEGWIAANTIAFMREAVAAERPFIVQASLPRPHQCTAPSEPFWSMYEGVDLTLPPNADYDQRAAKKAPHVIAAADNWRTGNWALIEPKTFEAARLRKLRGYLGAVSQVDHAVGQMVGFLDEAGIADDTIVIYTSDHGDYATEHGLMEKAPGICHDAITRIPHIWRYPGTTKAGHVAPELVETVDLSATICSLAGLPAMETSDGKDITHILRGDGGEVRRVGVTEFAWSKSVRRGKYRLVYYPPELFAADYPDGFGELYDLEADPWEMRNLFFESDHAQTVRELQGELLNWLITTTRPKTTNGANAGSSGTSAVSDPQHEQRRARYRTVVNADDKIHPDRLRNASHKNYI